MIKPNIIQSADQIRAILFSAIFFLIGASLISFHEMWRDEGQAWLLARASGNVWDLMSTIRYEGHQGLWHLLLMFLGFLSSNVAYMQFLHLGIATATIYLFLAWSPFSWLQKILFCFGYYTFYEYSIISRNYGIGIFFLFLFCTFFRSAKKKYCILGLIIFLLAQTNILGLIIAIAALVAMASQYLFYEDIEPTRSEKKYFWIGIFIAILGIALSILSVAPPQDSGFATVWYFYFDGERLKGALSALSNAFFPVPIISKHFWGNANWNQIFAAYLIAPFVIFIFIKLLLFLQKSKPIALFLVIGLFGIELFLYTKYLGSWRHQGYIYFLFVAAYWLAKDSIAGSMAGALNGKNQPSKNFLNIAFNFILVAQVSGGIIAHVYDRKFVFSYGNATAQYLRDENLVSHRISVFPDFIGPSILMFMDSKNTFYYPQSDLEGGYIKWDDRRNSHMVLEEALSRSLLQIAPQESGIIFITNSPIAENLLKKWNMQFIKSFDGAIVEDENFYIYLLKGR